MNFSHIPVLYDELIENMNINPNGIYVDATLGGGGHSEGILKRLESGKLIGIDQDISAIQATSKKLEKYDDKFISILGNFDKIKDYLADLNIGKVDGIIADIGVSSYQLDTVDRGFSYHQDARLDMRMDKSSTISAYDVVNKYSEDRLTQIIRDYGEERWANRIANFIVELRSDKPIETTFELVKVIKAAIPKKVRSEGSHPAKKTFQAIRIEVNRELDRLENLIDASVDILKSGGRVGIITFHSLEDRIVKNKFKDYSISCICPPTFPICKCDVDKKLDIITRKPIIPTEEEIERNNRARSAKLRIAKRV